MESLVILAAAIPFAIIVVVLTVLATVRYGVTDAHLQVQVLWLTIRKIPLSDVESVEFVPAEPGKSWGLMRHGGMVVVQAGAGRTVAISPRDPEEFSRGLKEVIFRLTGRSV